MAAALNQIKTTLGVQEEEKSMQEEVCEMCPAMSYKMRIIAFAICCGIGYLLSFMGTMTLISGTNPETIRSFCVLYILGNFVAIGATLFLVGPKSQCKKMFDKRRRITCIFWLSTLVLVFVLALCSVNLGVIFLVLFVQILAGVWYSASYIPFGRKMIIKCCQGSLFSPCPQACDPIEKVAC